MVGLRPRSTGATTARRCRISSGYAKERRFRRLHRQLPHPRLADQPPALLGRADPDRALPACGAVPVPEKDLPVLLPDDVDFKPSAATRWRPRGLHPDDLPACGKPARRETDTLAQWLCSCWYFLRYVNPRDERPRL
jgi:hypothetical protein